MRFEQIVLSKSQVDSDFKNIYSTERVNVFLIKDNPTIICTAKAVVYESVIAGLSQHTRDIEPLLF